MRQPLGNHLEILSTFSTTAAVSNLCSSSSKNERTLGRIWSHPHFSKTIFESILHDWLPSFFSLLFLPDAYLSSCIVLSRLLWYSLFSSHCFATLRYDSFTVYCTHSTVRWKCKTPITLRKLHLIVLSSSCFEKQINDLDCTLLITRSDSSFKFLSYFQKPL